MSIDQRAEPPIVIVAFNGYLLGLHPRTGATLWEHSERIGANARLHVTASFTLVLGGGVLLCLDTMSGRVHWKAESHGSTLLYPGGPFVFSAPLGELECFAIQDGRCLWRQPFKGKGHSAVAVGVPGAAAQADATQ